MSFEITPTRILSTQEMGHCDRFAISEGTPGTVLMERAGQAVVEVILARQKPCKVAVICGPGNNGGDGYVVARLLKNIGWNVRVYALTKRELLQGDAKHHAEKWCGEIMPIEAFHTKNHDFIVDALFGTGLARELNKNLVALINNVAEAHLPVVAIDIPSGIDGNTGKIMASAFRATLTVTFHRLKPGHLLQPGRSKVGEIIVADIGIPDSAEAQISPPELHENRPELWTRFLPIPNAYDHKYSRGHAVILGGERMTGAARLAAHAAKRIGAGLCGIATPVSAFQIYAISEPGVLLDIADDAGEFASAINDSRKNAVLIGPGSGINARTQQAVEIALATDKSVILDADALSIFRNDPQILFDTIRARSADETVLTPHAGEFSRLFFDIDLNDKIAATRQASHRSNAVVLLKGSDTVIASPSGDARINSNAPPSLATAGSGDVLAGAIVGLIAQGLSGFDAASMAAWVLGATAQNQQAGLIAEDLPDATRPILEHLRRLVGGQVSTMSNTE